MILDIEASVRRASFTLAAQVRLDQPATDIFGPSGAGKSSLLHLICGLVRPDRGRVVLDGIVLDDAAAGIHVPTHRRRIGVVFQHGHLLPHLNVEGNLRYGERLVPMAVHRERDRRIAFADVVRLLDIGHLRDRRPRTLSGGERQRVALGRALLCSPRLLLLDEPLAALDQALKRQILPYLRRVREHFAIPILYVGHDLGELLHVCDHLLLIDRGAIMAQGSLVDLAKDPRLVSRLHAAGLVNVLRGQVLRHEPAEGLTQVELVGGPQVACALRSEQPGTSIDLLLRPEDIALALAAVPGISLQNQLPGRINSLVDVGDRVLVTIDVGQPLLTEVSARAVAQLGLEVGRPVVGLFKAVALASRGGADEPARQPEDFQRTSPLRGVPAAPEESASPSQVLVCPGAARPRNAPSALPREQSEGCS